MKYEDLIVYTPTQKMPSNFVDRVGWENEYFKVVSRAPNKNGRTQWNCLCKACGEYCVKDSSNLVKHKSCGCNRSARISAARRKDLTGQRFGKLVAIEYAGYTNASRNAVWKCRCDCGNLTEVDSNNLITLHTISCGCINYSIGVKNIIDILEQNNISYVTEYKITELFDNDPTHPFRFDFAILKDGKPIRFIEYDGIQHTVQTWGKWKGTISLDKQKERDARKNEWALTNKIPLVRIPYWERDNITLEMLMSDKYEVIK